MAFNIVNNTASIDGASGKYGKQQKGAVYGKNAATNQKSYINSLKTATTSINPDTFTKECPIRQMAAEVQKFEQENYPPINFILQYAPKISGVKAFFTKLFCGNVIDKQALLGYTHETMGEKSITVEEADKQLQDTFSDITNAKLTAKAFDVNNDGKIDISEEAVSTIVADILSKDEDTSDKIKIDKNDIKKADGTYTNKGENKMLALFNEKNLASAKEITANIHKILKLDKAMEKYNAKSQN